MFTAAGHPINQSSLSRWIADRAFPVTQRGKAKQVDPNALFELWANDFSRLNMSGQGTTIAALAPSRTAPDSAGGRSSPPAGANLPSNPKLRAAELDVQNRELDLAMRLGRAVPAEEMVTANAVAVAELRAAFSQAVQEEADRLLAELHLPAQRRGDVRAALKRFARVGQEKFARRLATRARDAESPEPADLALLEKAVAFVLELMERDLEGAPVERETTEA